MVISLFKALFTLPTQCYPQVLEPILKYKNKLQTCSSEAKQAKHEDLGKCYLSIAAHVDFDDCEL